MPKTFGSILSANRGVGAGFDLLRILLAFVIFYGHAKWAAGHSILDHAPAAFAATNPVNLERGGWEGWRRPILVSYVPAFFALSGYLVSASAFRTRFTSTFLAHRALRIFPALIVEVTLSGIVIGLFLTSYAPAAYFTDPLFFRYFGNIVGWISFYLPGVFENNPSTTAVNVNLWTLPAEFDCYLMTAALMVTGLFYKRIIFTVTFVTLTIVFACLNLTSQFGVSPTTLPGFAVTYYFFMGVFFYHWRDYIPQHVVIFVLALACSYALQSGHHAVFFAPVFVVYATLFFGHAAIPKVPLIGRGDYSYGMYLYGFPITQACVALIPGLRGNGWATLGVSLAITMCFAVFSWHVIESKMLRLKSRLPVTFFPTAKSRAADMSIASVPH